MCAVSFIQERAAHISMYRAAVNKNYAQFKISQTHEELKEKERGIPAAAHFTYTHIAKFSLSLSSGLKPARQNTHTPLNLKGKGSLSL